MSDLDLKALRADVDGWSGTFEMVRDHRCHYCDDDGGVDGSILYRPEEDTHEGCEALVHISDVEHAHPGCGESLVRMLNAVGPLVAEVERLRVEVEALKSRVQALLPGWTL